MKTYQGACHCGRVRFEVDLDLDHVRSCDCSICRRRGALIHRVAAERFRLLTRHRTAREAALGMSEFSGWSINVRCLDDVELDAIPVKQIRGSELD